MAEFFRPEALNALSRLREVIVSALIAAFGLWLIRLGGYFLWPLGVAVVVLGIGLGLLALRRLRFVQDVASPGVVEVDEGQVAYLGPSTGGFISLRELIELRLLTLRGRRMWRMKQADGQALLVPVDAIGSEALFDAFANLPGMDTQALVASLEGHAAAKGQIARQPGVAPMQSQPEMLLIWRKRGAGLVKGTV